MTGKDNKDGISGGEQLILTTAWSTSTISF